jgi:phosphohistidine phosphatase
MRLYLVHHGEALSPELDPRRPLTSKGLEHVERVATEAAERGIKPAAIWHSGKLRARQTAEPFWRACNPLAEFTAVRGLEPDDPPEWIRDRLAGEPRDLMLVGHLPNLPKLLSLLLDPRPERPLLWFPQHSLVALTGDDDGWTEQYRLGTSDH